MAWKGYALTNRDMIEIAKLRRDGYSSSWRDIGIQYGKHHTALYRAWTLWNSRQGIIFRIRLKLRLI